MEWDHEDQGSLQLLDLGLEDEQEEGGVVFGVVSGVGSDARGIKGKHSDIERRAGEERWTNEL